MDMQERIKALKAYAIGGVVGAVALAVVGFSADLVVTTGTMNEKVREETVAAYAAVCESGALAEWSAQGNELSALGGWRNEQRARLVEQFVPVGAETDLHRDVSRACDSLLRTA